MLVEHAVSTSQAMWENKSERPICSVVLFEDDSSCLQCKEPLLSQANCNDFSISAKEIVNRFDLELRRRTYLGDAFPNINMDCFGPGVVAAFLGAELDNSTGRVWFRPKNQLPISQLHFEYNEDSVWLHRILDIYEAAAEKWKGSVIMGLPDLGGIMDILSTFRPGELLLYDLYDEPEEVTRLINEIHEVWHMYYQKIISILRQASPYHTDWSGLISDTDSYVIQEDFSYMIGPNMFEQFVLPELKSLSARLNRTLYHLDGPGELVHLDQLLKIKELNGIQWVTGDGNSEGADPCWDDVYRRILEHDKFIQLSYVSLESMKELFKRFDSKHFVTQTIWLPESEKMCAIRDLKELGCL